MPGGFSKGTFSEFVFTFSFSFLCSEIDYVQFTIKNGQHNLAHAKLTLELRIFAKPGWTFNKFGLTVEVTQLLREGTLLERSGAFHGSLSNNRKQLFYMFYVRQDTTYLFTVLDKSLELVSHQFDSSVLTVPIRYVVCKVFQIFQSVHVCPMPDCRVKRNLSRFFLP